MNNQYSENSNYQNKFILVCDKETEEAANSIKQLVSDTNTKLYFEEEKQESWQDLVDNRKEPLEVVVWLENVYNDNKSQLSSKNRIVFVGNFEATKKNRTMSKIRYNKYGAVISSIGNSAFLYVENTDIKSGDLEEMKNYVKKYFDTSNVKDLSFWKVFSEAMTIFWPYMLSKYFRYRKDILNFKYNFLAVLFVREFVSTLWSKKQ